jgi:hypothetical protein
MNDEKTTEPQGLSFTPKDIREGYRKDGSFFAICSVCNEHISNMVSDSTWMHELIINRTYHSNGDILMNQSKKVDYCPTLKLKEEEVVIVSKLTDAYKLVIKDIYQDIGYVENAKETAMSVLLGRLNELETVWSETEETSAV